MQTRNPAIHTYKKISFTSQEIRTQSEKTEKSKQTKNEKRNKTTKKAKKNTNERADGRTDGRANERTNKRTTCEMLPEGSSLPRQALVATTDRKPHAPPRL
jgi:hypothetical protein